MLEKKRIQENAPHEAHQHMVDLGRCSSSTTSVQLELGSLLNGKELPFESLEARMEILRIEGHLDRHTPAEVGIRLRYMQAHLIEHVAGLHVEPIGNLDYFTFHLQVR